MMRFIVLLLIAGGIGWFFFRDQITDLIRPPTHAAGKQMYRWKDEKGAVHYSSNAADAPRGAKPADLPDIGIVPAQKVAPEKPPEKVSGPAQAEGDFEHPKPSQPRNPALERMEKAGEKLNK